MNSVFASFPPAVKSLFAPFTSPVLDAMPRPGCLPESEVRRLVADLHQNITLPFTARDSALALVLAWHDHWEAAHHVCQENNLPASCYIHGILHRREPDFGNARYWFRQVPEHFVYGCLGSRLLAEPSVSGDSELLGRLVVGGKWQPLAFVDACERCQEPSQREVLRRIQTLEFACWMEFFMRP